MSPSSETKHEVVPVALGGRSYDIHIGQGLLAQSGALLRPLLRSARVVIVTDTTVASLYLAPFTRSLQQAGLQVLNVVSLEPGEGTKTLATYQQLTEALLADGLQRTDTILALGGGVIGDIAGFAAATVLRGVDYIQIPTTLLAQVDSSVGGKTAVNSAGGKNLVGAFHQPRGVIIDPAVLSTLPPREMRAGYAEVIKYGLIDDAPFYTWCLARGADLLAGEAGALAHALATCCRNKARIVAQDETESGPRMLLNFGHTFGHALEAETGYDGRLLHGEAVAVGMVMALRLSARLQLCPPALAHQLAAHLRTLGLPTQVEDTPCAGTSPEVLLAHMKKDKKAEGDALTLILCREPGACFIARDTLATPDLWG